MQKPVLILKLNLWKLTVSLFQMKLMLLKLSHPQALMSFQSQPSQSAVLVRCGRPSTMLPPIMFLETLPACLGLLQLPFYSRTAGETMGLWSKTQPSSTTPRASGGVAVHSQLSIPANAERVRS